MTSRDVNIEASRAAPDFSRMSARWPDYLTAEFKAMKPVAVWIAGSRKLVSVTTYNDDGTPDRIIGGNQRVRAVKLGVSRFWNDEVSWRVAFGQPFVEQQLLCRVWVKSDDDAKLLMLAMVRRLVDGNKDGTTLLRDWIDIGPLKVTDLGPEFVAAAQDNMIEYWSDHALVTHLLGRANARAARHERAFDPVRRPRLVSSR